MELWDFKNIYQEHPIEISKSMPLTSMPQRRVRVVEHKDSE